MKEVKSSLSYTDFLHEFVGFAPAIILTVFFCRLSIFLLSGELPPPKNKIIPCFIVE